MTQIRTVALALVVGLAAAGCASKSGGDAAGTKPADSSAAMSCAGCAEKMKSGENFWCDGCKMGMVGGEKVTCAGCYAQKTGGPACPTCSKKN
jgi:hypothetical protein